MRDTGHEITEKCSSEEIAFVNEEIEKVEVRWKELTSNAKKRKQAIEENYEMSSMFFEGAEKLKESFDDVSLRIKSDQSIGKDKAMVREQIKKHKVSSCLCVLRIYLSGNYCFSFIFSIAQHFWKVFSLMCSAIYSVFSLCIALCTPQSISSLLYLIRPLFLHCFIY